MVDNEITNYKIDRLEQEIDRLRAKIHELTMEIIYFKLGLLAIAGIGFLSALIIIFHFI